METLVQLSELDRHDRVHIPLQQLIIAKAEVKFDAMGVNDLPPSTPKSDREISRSTRVICSE